MPRPCCDCRRSSTADATSPEDPESADTGGSASAAPRGSGPRAGTAARQPGATSAQRVCAGARGVARGGLTGRRPGRLSRGRRDCVGVLPELSIVPRRPKRSPSHSGGRHKDHAMRSHRYASALGSLWTGMRSARPCSYSAMMSPRRYMALSGRASARVRAWSSQATLPSENARRRARTATHARSR